MNARHRREVPTFQELRDFDSAFDRAFVLVAYSMNRYLVDHWLRAGRQLTGDDHEALIIWGVVAHQNVAHLMPPGSIPSALLNDKGRLDISDEGLRPLRQRDIVQITGIARETVRRKLKKLEAERWIARNSRGWIVSSERTEPDLRDFTRNSVRRFLTTAEDMMHMLRDAESCAKGQ